MRRNVYSSRTPFNPTASAPDYRGPIATLPGLPRLRMPTLAETLDPANPHPLMELSDKPPSEPPSLFEGLLGGQLQVLVDDAEKNPDRYDDRTRDFLEELSAGREMKTLSRDEKALLDSAVMDFASYRPKRPTEAKTPARAERPTALEEEPAEEKAAQMELPDEAPPAYWWL